VALTIQITGDASGAVRAVGEASAAVTAKLGEIDKRQQELAQRTTSTYAKIEQDWQRYQRMTRSTADVVAEQTTRMARQLGGLESVMGRMTRAAISLGVGLGVAGLARSIVDAGLEAERFERTLQAATGSVEEAQRAMTFIVSTSNQLGQSITAMVPAFVQLAAATRNTALEGEKTRALFTALGGASGGVEHRRGGAGDDRIDADHLAERDPIGRIQESIQFAGARCDARDGESTR
jgi:hypothetical protein